MPLPWRADSETSGAWPRNPCIQNAELFSEGAVGGVFAFRQSKLHEQEGEAATRSGCLTAMIAVVRTPAAAPAQTRVKRRLPLCHPASQL